jgi:predicted nucleic acid-binding protein
MFAEDFGRAILPFDHAAALAYADIVVQRERAGRPIATADAQIAAISREQHATLATRNGRDFDDLGLDLIDPWSVDT